MKKNEKTKQMKTKKKEKTGENEKDNENVEGKKINTNDTKRGR